MNQIENIQEILDDLGCLKIQTVAERLTVSPDTVRRLIKRGKLKAIKVGKNVRILGWSLNEYVRNHSIEAQSAVEEATPRRKTSNGAGYRAALRKAEELGFSL